MARCARHCYTHDVGDEDIQHTSESALLTAGWRAMESSRADALFHDPLAAGLAGERGLRIARTLPDGAWVVAIRTVPIDAFVNSAISSGIDTVINLGAGMDTRPYRMDLPASLHWVEVDLPSLIESKDAQLSTEVPACSIERVGLDLADRDARRELFDRIFATSTRATVLTEGVLGDLSVDEAGGLADDLRAQPACESWGIDYFSARSSRPIRSTSRIPTSRSVSIHPAGRRSSPNTAGASRRSGSLGRSPNGSTDRSRSRDSTRSCVSSRLDRFGTWATRASIGFAEGSTARVTIATNTSWKVSQSQIRCVGPSTTGMDASWRPSQTGCRPMKSEPLLRASARLFRREPLWLLAREGRRLSPST
jgi:methyltransferase (TIGR00027 family)